MQTKPVLKYYLAKELSPEEWCRIVILLNSVWPLVNKTVDEKIQELLKQHEKGSDTEVFVMWDKGNAIAHARIFPRRIRSKTEELRIMALAGVCVSEVQRGKGFGKQIVEITFEQVRNGRFPAALFQTGIPEFYRRLGAFNIDNEFRNSKDPNKPDESPWWETYVMVYPGPENWPEGKIDLNGPAY